MKELNQLEQTKWIKFQAICEMSEKLLLESQIKKYAHLDYDTRTLWEGRTSNWTRPYFEGLEDACATLVFSSGSGIGIAVDAYHEGLRIKCDITDYDCW